MKILLVGEYSRLHNSLQEGLRDLGHEVILISTGDYFKKYPSDLKIKRTFDTGLARKIKIGMYQLFNIELTSWHMTMQFFNTSQKLKGFDVVQLINESPFGATPKNEIKMISFLKQNNKKLFLLCCGTDYLSVKHQLSDANPYSILSAYKDGSVSKDQFKNILKYLTPPFKKLHDFVFENIDGCIASDYDYHMPLVDNKKYLGLIPNPINRSKLRVCEIDTGGPIVIFMGINRTNYHSKGISYFEKALAIIKQKFPKKVQVEIVENLPYTQYIEKYNNAHIILDQVFAYDQGYNALEAMAKAKVVFTGAESCFMKHYKLVNPVAINALPNVDSLVLALEDLVKNPEKITEIGLAAQRFIKVHHDHKKIAQQYLEAWK
ncbi:MAG: glycosyltransferase involved in cell wall biosynthesis [Patiriisocius sp.]|jgi:glycosyltransferase involved in cell wall biosynthesis